MNRHYPLDKIIAPSPRTFGQIGKLIDLFDAQGWEGARKTGCRSGCKYEFERIGQIAPTLRRRARSERYGHAMFGVFDDRRAMEPQEFQISMKIRRGDIQVQRVARWEERLFYFAFGHCRKRPFQQTRKTDAGKWRFEPPPAYEVRDLAFDLCPRFRCDGIGEITARAVQ